MLWYCYFFKARSVISAWWQLKMIDTCNPPILIFYFCPTNNQNPSSLKPHPFIISQFCRSEVLYGVARFPAQGLSRVASQCQVCLWPPSWLGGCWQNSFPCSCRTQFFLVGCWPGATLSSRGACSSLACALWVIPNMVACCCLRLARAQLSWHPISNFLRAPWLTQAHPGSLSLIHSKSVV